MHCKTFRKFVVLHWIARHCRWISKNDCPWLRKVRFQRPSVLWFNITDIFLNTYRTKYVCLSFQSFIKNNLYNYIMFARTLQHDSQQLNLHRGGLQCSRLQRQLNFIQLKSILSRALFAVACGGSVLELRPPHITIVQQSSCTILQTCGSALPLKIKLPRWIAIPMQTSFREQKLFILYCKL